MIGQLELDRVAIDIKHASRVLNETLQYTHYTKMTEDGPCTCNFSTYFSFVIYVFYWFKRIRKFAAHLHII